MTLVCKTWRLAPQTGTTADTYSPVSPLMPSLVFVSFAAPSAPLCPVSQPQGKILWWVLQGREPRLVKPVSATEAAPYQSVSLQEQAKTVDETRYLCSPAVGQAEAHVFMRTGEQAASHHSYCIKQRIPSSSCSDGCMCLAVEVWHFKQAVLTQMCESGP